MSRQRELHLLVSLKKRYKLTTEQARAIIDELDEKRGFKEDAPTAPGSPSAPKPSAVPA